MREDGHIGLIDFGMVGVVDEQTRAELAILLSGMISQDSDRIADALLELGASQQPVDRAERIANRIVLGIIIAALIVGLSMLVSAYRPGVPGVWEVLLTIGLILAGVLAIYLVWSIFRSGRQ